MLYTLLCCSALLLAYVNAADEHRHCVTPPNWEATTIIKGHVVKDHHADHFGVHSHYHQDGQRHRVAIYEMVDYQGNQDYYHKIYLHHHEEHHPEPGVEFRINLKTKECTKHELDYPFRPIEIPSNATHHSEQYVGSAGYRDGSVLTGFYTASFEHEHGKARWQGIFTSRDTGCFPVSEVFESKRHEETEVTSMEFFNVVLGISDPSIFYPPEECFE